jgi:hypothetical protein
MSQDTKATNESAGQPSAGATVSQPVRIQLSRQRGWKMPPNTVKVDRTTMWGNPCEVVPFTPDGEKELRGINAEFRCFTAVEAVFRFSYFLSRVKQDGGGRMFAVEIVDNLHKLKGKNLGCWCKVGTPCHADILLKLANKQLSDS